MTSHNENVEPDAQSQVSAITEREALEAEKIRQELADLRRPYLFRNPQVLTALITTIGALAAVALLLDGKYFEARDMRNQLQELRTQLTREDSERAHLEADRVKTEAAATVDEWTRKATAANRSANEAIQNAQRADLQRRDAFERLGSANRVLDKLNRQQAQTQSDLVAATTQVNDLSTRIDSLKKIERRLIVLANFRVLAPDFWQMGPLLVEAKGLPFPLGAHDVLILSPGGFQPEPHLEPRMWNLKATDLTPDQFWRAMEFDTQLNTRSDELCARRSLLESWLYERDAPDVIKPTFGCRVYYATDIGDQAVREYIGALGAFVLNQSRGTDPVYFGADSQELTVEEVQWATQEIVESVKTRRDYAVRYSGTPPAEQTKPSAYYRAIPTWLYWARVKLGMPNFSNEPRWADLRLSTPRVDVKERVYQVSICSSEPPRKGTSISVNRNFNDDFNVDMEELTRTMNTTLPAGFQGCKRQKIAGRAYRLTSPTDAQLLHAMLALESLREVIDIELAQLESQLRRSLVEAAGQTAGTH